jgi:xanthine dehydrogenase YagS FAD-binding subunit
VITAVEVDARSAARAVACEEIRQKAMFDWALVTAAVRLRREGIGVGEASVWLGAVAPTPYRATRAEEVLAGRPFTLERAAEAGAAAATGATPLPGNGYKTRLVAVAVRRAIERAWGRA